MKNDRVFNRLTLLSLILTASVTLCYLLIFLIPQIPINPFKPVALLAPGESSATPTPGPTLPPTWTPTSVPSPISPRATATPTLTPTPRPTRTRAPSPTPTLNPLIPTRSPFKFTASPPVFTTDPYGAACGNWGGVGGQVFDVDGSPLKGESVVGWGGPIPEQQKKVFTSGSDSRINQFYNGAGAYEIFIGAPGDFDFNVAVYENGQAVSPIVKVKMVNSCAQDLVLINFQRNH